MKKRRLVCSVTALAIALVPAILVVGIPIKGLIRWGKKTTQEDDQKKLLFVGMGLARDYVDLERPETFRVVAKVDYSCTWSTRAQDPTPQRYVDYTSSVDVLDALNAWLRRGEYARSDSAQPWDKLKPELVAVDLRLRRTCYYEGLDADVERYILEAQKMAHNNTKASIWREGNTIIAEVRRHDDHRPAETAWNTQQEVVNLFNEPERHMRFRKDKISQEIHLTAQYALRPM